MGGTDRSTVMIVDDDTDIRSFLAVFLESRGYDVMTAEDGAVALDQLRDRRPDAILLDVTMPVLDGWAVLDRMKAADEGIGATAGDVPVVMVTALGTVPDRVRGGIGGALHYLTKPFELDELLGALDDILDDDAPPEPQRRLAVQQSALSQLARLEAGSAVDTNVVVRPQVHLTRLESTAPAAPSRRGAIPPSAADARRRLDGLAPGQLRLLEQLVASTSVATAARDLGVSRSNIYASLRRICRRLEVAGIPELLALLRVGGLLD